MEIQSQAFEVRRDQLAETRIVSEAVPPAEPGEALLRIDAFALTANNITYGVTGDMIGYWQFFPAADEGWGRIPVWGFADVLSSELVDVADLLRNDFPQALLRPTHLRPVAVQLAVTDPPGSGGQGRHPALGTAHEVYFLQIPEYDS